MIREMTWPRSVAVGVVNENGSSGKTPLTLCLAGTLASIRGGGVVAYDAARSKNGLDLICEGRPSHAAGSRGEPAVGRVDLLLHGATALLEFQWD